MKRSNELLLKSFDKPEKAKKPHETLDIKLCASGYESSFSHELANSDSEDRDSTEIFIEDQ